MAEQVERARIELDTRAKGDAPRQLRDMVGSLEKTSRLQAEVTRRFTQMAARAGAAALSVQGVRAAMEFAAAAADAWADSTLTLAQRQQGIAESIPVVGGLVKLYREITEAIDGTTDALRQNRLAQERLLAVERARLAGSLRIAQAQREARRAGFLAEALAGPAPAALPTPDRSTAAGRVAFEAAQRLQPLLDAEVTARRRAAAAQRESAAAAADLAALQRTQAELERDRARTQERINALRAAENEGTRRKADLDSALHARQRLDVQIAGNLKRIEDARNAAKAAGLDLARQEAAARQAGLAVAREELNILAEREQRSASLAQRLGALNPAQRAIAAQAAEAIQRFGAARVPPAFRDLARQVVPEFVAKEEERAGAATPEFRRLAPLIGAQDLGEIRRQVDAKRAEVRLQVILDEAELARQFKDVLGPLIRDVKRDVLAEVRQAERGVRDVQEIRNNERF